MALLKKPGEKTFREFWLKKSKDTGWLPLVNHMIKHVGCYSNAGFVRLLSLLQEVPSETQVEDWKAPIKVIHDDSRVSIGTEEYHIIQSFCQTLSKPRKLSSRKHALESIHLAPRIICDPTPLDMQISLSYGKPTDEDWASVSYFCDGKADTIKLGLEAGDPLTAIEYWLNLEDVYPTSGGLISHGKSVLQRALSALGIRSEPDGTYAASIEFSETTLAV